MAAKTAEFALDEPGIDRFGGFPDHRGAALGAVLMLLQPPQANLGAFAGAAERCRLLGQYLVAKCIEAGFGKRICGEISRWAKCHAHLFVARGLRLFRFSGLDSTLGPEI